MDRQELIQTLIPGLVKSTSSTARDVEGVLNTYEMDGLKKELARQRKLGYLQTPTEDIANDPEIIRQVEAIRAEARAQVERKYAGADQAKREESEAFYRSYYLDQAFSIVFKGKRPVRNKASEEIVIGWIHPGESLSASWLLKVLNEQPGLADQLQWRSASVNQDAVDRSTFENAANNLRSFGINEANFTLTREVLGPDFTILEIKTAIANGLQLSKPSQSEWEKWAAEDIAAHNNMLLNASPTELKTLARQESEQKRIDEQATQAQANLDSHQQRESTMGFPQIPADITRDRIMKASPSEIKFWSKRYGQFQLNRILAGQEN